MPNQDTTTFPAGLDVKNFLVELEVPFPPDQVQWRVSNTTNDKKRGQVVPYADPRAYTDRLNTLFSPQGWTREYKIETMNNITRVKKGETIVTGKVLVTCTVTIIGLWSHSGTGEDWADDENGMTSADAQAFKRACSCFGLGRYFYDLHGPWVDLDQNRQPKKTPALPPWAIPENWRRGTRPPGKNGNLNAAASNGTPPNAGSNVNNGHAVGSQTIPANGNGGNGNGQSATGRANGGDAPPVQSGDLDERIRRMEKVVGTPLYRNVLRKYGHANRPKLIRDLAAKQKVLQILESAMRGFKRLDAVTKRLDPNTIEVLMTKLQAPPRNEIADMKTLQDIVFGLEELAGANPHHAV